MGLSDDRARYSKSAALAALLLGFLATMAGVDRYLMPAQSTEFEVREWELPEILPTVSGDQMLLERSLASLDWQLGQPEGINADSEKALVVAVAAFHPEDTEPLPSPVTDFISRSFPDRGAQLGSLLGCFAGYKQLEAATSPAADGSLEGVLAHQVDLQTACFGEPLAARLFERYQQMHSSFVSPDGLENGASPSRLPIECDIAACQAVRGDLYDW